MTSGSQPAPTETSRISLPRMALLIVIFLVIAFVIPHPSSVKPSDWRFFSIFVVTVLGLMIEPIPGGALVLLGVTLAALVGGMTLPRALSGYSDSVVWLVLTSNFIARALIKTGLAQRLALSFVRLFGKSPIRLCYSLSLSDMVLATIVPANSARSGGIILPIAISVSELYESYPGPTATKIGSFLVSALYQCICITPAMFLTGQVSNLLAAQMADHFGYHISWLGWAASGIVPGLVSLAVVPLIVWRLNPPEIRSTPEASAFAGTRLQQMGPMTKQEKILTVVFVGVCLLWVTASWNKIEITASALLAILVLLFAGILNWEDIKGEKGAWDIFIWYGGLMFFGRALNDIGIPKLFASWIGSYFGGGEWLTLFVLTLLIYFYSHYIFASITNHLVAMYSAFVALLLLKHAPLGLVVFSFACFANLSAGLTHYGTTPAPMFFSKKYVSLRLWWKIGLVVSVVNIVIWSSIGFGWWRLIRVW
jgi:DASS family divalent anion:Na+ symporter